MATFSRSDDLQGAEFTGTDLRGARFVGADLSGVVMRGVEVQGTEIDAPWLLEGDSFLRVNGVDVIPFVEAELNRRFPGRADGEPEIRTACAQPGPRSSTPGRPRSSVPRRCRRARSTCQWTASGRSRRRCGTWSWPQTRGWAGRSWRSSSRTIPSVSWTPAPTGEGLDMSIFMTDMPPYAEVLEVRAGRVAMVRDFLAAVTPDELAAARTNPCEPRRPPGDRPVLPAHDPRGGVGASPLRRTRPRRDRGEMIEVADYDPSRGPMVSQAVRA